MKRYPLAHKVIIPTPYVEACATDIRKTIKAKRKELDAAPPLPPSDMTTEEAHRVVEAHRQSDGAQVYDFWKKLTTPKTAS